MGRKREFSQEELDGMQRMRDAGESVTDIASTYHTTAYKVYKLTDGPLAKLSITELFEDWDRTRVYVLDGLRKAGKMGRKPLKK